MRLSFSVLGFFLTLNAALAIPVPVDPLYNLVKVNGEPVSFAQDRQRPAAGAFAKSQLIVYFWASHCTSCLKPLRETLPELAQQASTEVLAVNLDSDVQAMTRFIEKNEISVPVARDLDRKLAQSLQLKGGAETGYWAVYERRSAGSKLSPWKLIASVGDVELEKIKNVDPR